VQARILALQSEHDLTVMTTKVQGSGRGDTALSCYCKSNKSDHLLLVGCVQCRTFVHGKCVGIESKSAIPEDWHCDSCRLGHILAREEHRFPGMKEYIDSSYVVRHVFQSSLAHRLGVETAKQFHLARWMDELDQKCKTNGWLLNPRTIIGELLEFWDKPGPAGEHLTEEGGNRAILFVAAKGTPLMLSFRCQIRFVLTLMADNGSHTLRKLSLKAIEKVSSTALETDAASHHHELSIPSAHRRVYFRARSCRFSGGIVCRLVAGCCYYVPFVATGVFAGRGDQCA
jgi:hypothetical protein